MAGLLSKSTIAPTIYISLAFKAHLATRLKLRLKVKIAEKARRLQSLMRAADGLSGKAGFGETAFAFPLLLSRRDCRSQSRVTPAKKMAVNGALAWGGHFSAVFWDSVNNKL